MPVRFEQFAKADQFDSSKRWLIIGKGPTLDRIDEVDLDAYNTAALNHVPLALPARRFDILHSIDIEVITGSANARGVWPFLDESCRFLLMPELPNENMEAGRVSLAMWSSILWPLRKLDESGRLVGYRLAEGTIAEAPGQIVAPQFSACAVLCIIGLLGGKEVRTIGVDGGVKYAKAFAEMHALENRQPSFDVQFEQHKAICEYYGMTYDPLFETY